MTYMKLYQSYLTWANKLGAEPQKEIDTKASLVREISETDVLRTLEAFHTVCAFTDRLHLFVFSEFITSKKNKNGDDGIIANRDYIILTTL